MTQKSKAIPITAKSDNQLQILSALVSRAMMFQKLGYDYGGDRNLYTALGYSTQLKYEDFVAQYERQELAKAVIDRPVSATWRGGFDLLESDDDTETKLEKAWAELYDKLSLRSVFARLDRLTGLGRYGVLFLGLSDAKTVTDQMQPVQGVKHDLLYVRPYGEGHAMILQYETDTSNPRYGLPNLYQLTNTDLLSNAMVTLQVHHSRVIHVSDGSLESDIEGTPRLEAVFNRLKDVEKIAGGSAEMFWRGARPGYAFNMDPEFNMTQTMRDTLIDVFDEYEHNLRRILELQGGKLESLAQQVVDPQGHIDTQIQLISAETQIPKRILTGSERGELASSQDNESWQATIQGRREEFAEPSIIRPFVDRLIGWKILPEAGEGGYSIRWLDLFAMSEKEKVEIGVRRTEAIAKYASSPGAPSVIPAKSFYRVGLALDDEQIELIEEELAQALADAKKEEAELPEGPEIPEGGVKPADEKEEPETE